MKYTYTCQSNFWYTFEMIAFENRSKTIKNHPEFDTFIFKSIPKVRRVCSVLEWGTVQYGLCRANNLEFSIGMGNGSVLSFSM